MRRPKIYSLYALIGFLNNDKGTSLEKQCVSLDLLHSNFLLSGFKEADASFQVKLLFQVKILSLNVNYKYLKKEYITKNKIVYVF